MPIWESSLAEDSKTIERTIELDETEWAYCDMQAKRIGLDSGEEYLTACLDLAMWAHHLNTKKAKQARL